MTKKILYILLFFYSSAFSAKPLQNVNIVLQKYISALGGEKQLNKLSTFQIKGTLQLHNTITDMKPSAGRHGIFIFEGMLPHSYRMEEILDTMTYIDCRSHPVIALKDTIIDASNGNFDFDPDDQAAGYSRNIPDNIECNSLASPLGPLYYAWLKKLPVTIIDTCNQKDMIVLKIQFISGRYYLIYLDAKSFHELRRDYIRGETYRVIKTTFFSYKKIYGLLFPTKWQEMYDYYPLQSIYTIEDIQVNIPIDNSRFVKLKKK